MSSTAFLFPGQGAQVVGMGRQLAESLPAARALFDQAEEILGYDLAKLCFEGPAEKLNQTNIGQPALFVTSLAALESLRAESPERVTSCETTAGLSLGEYTALVFADAMDFADGLRLVHQRGTAMQAASEAQPSGMVSILGLDRDEVESLCRDAAEGEVLQMANFLCPGNIVISGSKAACERATELATTRGAMRAMPLPVAGAFHTPIMQPAVEQLAKALADVRIRTPRIPVLSNVDAKAHSDPEEIRELLTQQVVQPVLWEDSMRAFLDSGVQHFYEVGPGRVLRGLLKRIERKVACENVAA